MAKQQNLLSAAEVASLPQPPLRKSEDYLTAYKGYVYSSVTSIAEAVASIKLKLFKRKFTRKGIDTDEIFEHEALSLLYFANSQMTYYDLIEATQIYLDLVGESFWIMLRDQGRPAEIWPVRPDWMFVRPSAKQVVEKFIYRPGGIMAGGIEFDPKDVIHFKYFNPTNPYRGKGSVQAGAMVIDTHQFAQEWNRNFFFNSAQPGLVFTTEQRMNKETIDRFMASWQSKFGGRTNSNKVAFLSGGFKVDKISNTAKDMDFVELQRVMRDDILSVFKVPKSIVGLTEDVNRANAEATKLAFMERVVTPRMIKFVAHLNEFYLPNWAEDIFFDFDDPAPEDQEMKLRMYDSGLSLGWMTRNEVREHENLPPVKGGDELLVPFGMAPIGEEQNPNNNPNEKPEEDEDKSLIGKIFNRKKEDKVKYIKMPVIGRYKKERKFMMPIPPKRLKNMALDKLKGELKVDLIEMIGNMMKNNSGKKSKKSKSYWSTEKRDNYWLKMVSKTDVLESKMKQLMIPLFNEQEDIVLRNVESLKYYANDRKKGKESSFLFSITDETRKWVAVILPFQKEVVIEKGNEVLDFLGVNQPFDTFTRDSINFIRRDGARIVKGINQTTRDALRDTLADGLKKGESVDTLKSRIGKVFKDARGYRAENIARTEILRSTNFAANEAYSQSGIVKRKEWLTAIDERVTEGCKLMDGQIVEEGGNFKSSYYGVDLEYPPVHPQCRCTTIPVV